MQFRWLPFLAMLALAPTTALAADDEGDDVGGAITPPAGADAVFRRRILDGTTGRPVADATVTLHCEVPHPVPGPRRPLATAKSGADGWVTIKKADVDRTIAAVYGEPTWAFVEAPGLGPDADMFHGADGNDWPIGVATSRRIQLRDPLGRPVEGALVGYLLGCGHTPDVRQTRTDAQGIAAIERVWSEGMGRIWVVMDGLQSRYLEDDASSPWERLRPVTLDWAMTVEGTVLTHDGKPAVGVAVGHPNVHRGPWAITDADGRFRLLGSDVRPGGDCTLEAGEYPVGPSGASKPGLLFTSFRAPPPGHRALVRLPAPGAEAAVAPDLVRLVVEVDRSKWPEKFRASNVDVNVVRVEDGWTEIGRVGTQGVALLDVPAGRYVVEALGRHGEGEIVHSRSNADVTVPATGGAYVRVELPAPAMLYVFGPAATTDESTVELLAEGERQPIVNEEGRSGFDVLVPVGTALALRITQGSRTHIQPLLGVFERGGETEVRVERFEPVSLHARFVGTDGQPAAGWLLDPDSAHELPEDTVSVPDGVASPEATLSTLTGKNIRLIAWPEDATKYQPSFVDVPTLAKSEGTVDLGTIRFAPRAAGVRLESADGAPLDDARALVTRGERSEIRQVGRASWKSTLVDPWDTPGLLVEGASLHIEGTEQAGRGPERVVEAPLTRRLEGPGPWTIRRPAGQLTVDIQNESGAALAPWTVTLDDRPLEAWQENPARLRVIGLEAGPHEVLVESTGRVGKRLRFTLAEAEARLWAARLKSTSKPR